MKTKIEIKTSIGTIKRTTNSHYTHVVVCSGITEKEIRRRHGAGIAHGTKYLAQLETDLASDFMNSYQEDLARTRRNGCHEDRALEIAAEYREICRQCSAQSIETTKKSLDNQAQELQDALAQRTKHQDHAFCSRKDLALKRADAFRKYGWEHIEIIEILPEHKREVKPRVSKPRNNPAWLTVRR